MASIVLGALLCLGSQITQAKAQCNTYVVPGITGGFTTKMTINFTNARAGGDASAFLQ